MGWLATVGKCVGYLFGRSTQRADFEAVYKQMDSIATRLATEVTEYKQHIESLESQRIAYKREIEAKYDEFRETMLAKFDVLYRVNDECHKERRELLARVADLEMEVHKLREELAKYGADSNG